MMTESSMTQTSAPSFAIGQIWQYQTRSTEADSTLTIVKIEQTTADVTIVHISVQGLRIQNPNVPDGFGETIGHLPIDVVSLRSSVTHLVAQTEVLPDYEAGYAAWKEAFDAGQAGWFTISVSECVGFVEQAVNQ
jgi:hypothetical protein